MASKWWQVLAVAVLAAGYAGYDYYTSHQTPLASFSQKSNHVNQGKLGDGVKYGDVQDQTPSESLASSVLQNDVLDKIKYDKRTNITYNQAGAFILNDNKTNWTTVKTAKPYVHLSRLDWQKRPGVANALLSHETRQYQDRQSTGNAQTIKPVGWHQTAMKNHQSLYNRGHLIGYALAGNLPGFDASEANERNITTQTAWANQAASAQRTGQNYYEGLVRTALDQGEVVRYKVTPVYHKSGVVPMGNHLEAKSTDGQLEFNVFVPNVEPGVKIDYSSGVATLVDK